MATTVSPNVAPVDSHVLKRGWGWIFVLGILEIVLGTIAIGASYLATAVAVVFAGWMLLIGGILSAGHAFWRKHWKGFFLDLAIGVLYIVAGLMMVGNPVAAAVSLTLLIAMFLLMEGIFRIIVALSGQLEHRGWVMLNGLITAGLGILIWRQWPLSGLWVIGLFVGIEMIFYGWSLVMLSLVVKGAIVPAEAPAR
ncbi:MAG TPA: HdeD family acid-resistance protein [Planctomycetaceae bacterium]|nr:HdeD family acid-resistance protein [Planctomycetaceae bacterium]